MERSIGSLTYEPIVQPNVEMPLVWCQERITMTAFGRRFLTASACVSLAWFAVAPSIAAGIEYGSASVRIKVPTKPLTIRKNASGSRGLHSQYISASTKSFSIRANDLRPVAVNVFASDFVFVKLRLPAGTYSFTITAYDRAGATGNVLSTGVTPPVSVPARGNAQVAVTLAGVVASVAMSLGESHATVGSPANIGLQVNTKDADGSFIVGASGPQPLTQPITLTSSDPSAAAIGPTTLTQSGFTGSAFFTARVAYTGANVKQITFSARGAGLKSVTPAVLAPLLPPVSGEQIIATQYVDSISSFSTLPGYQFLGTLGIPPPAEPPTGNTTYYNEVAVDEASHRVYVATQQFLLTGQEPSRIDSFQTDSPRSFVDSIPLVTGGVSTVAGLAVDAAGKRLYASTYDATFNSGISIYSTATGHALLGRIADSRLSELAVDPVAGRLYSVSENVVAVYESSRPFAMLASFPNDYQYLTVAADSTTGKAYFFSSGVSGSPYPTPSFIDTFDGANLGRRIASTAIGTQYGGALALDRVGRRLYVTAPSLFPENDPGEPPSAIDAYSIDGGISLVGSFPLRSLGGGNGIAVAPYLTADAAPSRKISGSR